MAADNPSRPCGPDRQVAVFAGGMPADAPPGHPVSFEAREAEAEAALPATAVDYVAGGGRAVPRNFRPDRDLTLGLCGRTAVRDLDRGSRPGPPTPRSPPE